ncbi:glycerophosphodiester phosphodiesterase family protein [Aliagarivorans marinus]|uniref:glycerophosphodiester phosphodiesterase family protein n=1 Tax=Aliagarivorans marinus TaxID=561965 RepID=UPI000406851B|nr:glycerophosphodiester phosphodiesterase family protein [Aliagarivorans marinus]
MIIAGHRGVKSVCPENTLVGIAKVVELGLQWVEIDVQLSADGVPVIVHDRTVNRCSNGRGKVGELTLEQLRELDAGSWFDAAFANERIPTLAEALMLCQQLKLKLNLELKVYRGDHVEALCQAVAQQLADCQFASADLVLSSFEHEAMLLAKQLMPHYLRGQLWEGVPRNWLAQLQALDAYSAHCDWTRLSEAEARAIKQAGYQLYCYTANEPAKVRAHHQWGVDMLISDSPQAFINDREHDWLA